MIPSFETQREEWASPPVDGVGYIPSVRLLQCSDDELRALIQQTEEIRYQKVRNYKGLWRQTLGLDSTYDKWVLDYGCGIGIEALQYARAGNHVWIADIVQENVLLANRVLRLHGYAPDGMTVLFDNDTDWFRRGWFDVIHCVGVLHHIPDPIPTVRRMHEWLTEGGELRLMVYSDKGWRYATGTAPPQDVRTSPMFERFIRHFDSVGEWADWYDVDRLQARFGEWFEIVQAQYIMENEWFLTATLRRRS